MRDLPILVRRAPTIFYVAAVLFFLWSMALTFYELRATMGLANTYGDNPVVGAMVLRALFQSGLEAVHLAGTGVLAHILLAIWASGRTGVPDGGHE